MEYDLEERLLEFSVRVIRLVEALPGTSAGNLVANQLLRSATAPYAHHGEAQGAESPKDFVHKLRLGLKELRESERWLKLIMRVPLVEPPTKVDPLLKECDELIRIFVSSIRTAEENARRGANSKSLAPKSI